MATYYVRKDGNDNNTGTANTPEGALRTVTRALLKANNWFGEPHLSPEFDFEGTLGASDGDEIIIHKDVEYFYQKQPITPVEGMTGDYIRLPESEVAEKPRKFVFNGSTKLWQEELL